MNQKDECRRARDFACKKSREKLVSASQACIKVISKGSELKLGARGP